MLDFIGDQLDSFKDLTGNYFWGLVILALISKLIFFIIYRDYYKSIGIGELLKEDVEALRKKHKNNSKKANEEITKLLMANRYGMLGSLTLFLTEAAPCIWVGLALFEPLMHTAAASLDEFVVNQISLHTSPLWAMTQKYFSMNSAMSMFTVIAVVGLQIFHDTQMEEKRFVEQEKVDHAIWIAESFMCIVLPTGAALFMLTCKLADLLLLMYFSKKKYTKLATERIAKPASSKSSSGSSSNKTK
ncbi:MAG: YidC/Oxa1 family membrane protein insertase [Eubacteriaceae bacterium]|nr:YidC/Oxa1 family membrane protein insertase [Eubacteriaceae bacterium]